MRFRSRPSHATVVAYLALFVALGGTTYAATGGNFILGQPNSASSTTSLTRTGANTAKGLQVTNTSTGAGATALGLNVASGHAPFTVNSGTKVTNLNADKLDGIDSSGFLSSGSVKKLLYEDTAGPGGTPTALATVGPYAIKADCVDNGAGATGLALYANGPAGTADYMVDTASNFDSSHDQASGRLSIAASSNAAIANGVSALDNTNSRMAGTAMLKTGSTVVQVDFDGVADNPSAGIGGEHCYLYGTATKGT
jgi:hypothetical protein